MRNIRYQTNGRYREQEDEGSQKYVCVLGRGGAGAASRKHYKGAERCGIVDGSWVRKVMEAPKVWGSELTRAQGGTKRC